MDITDSQGVSVRIEYNWWFNQGSIVVDDNKLKGIASDGKIIIENRPVRNNIFKKIYNFLKALFSGYSVKSIIADQRAVGKLKELYDKHALTRFLDNELFVLR